MKFKKGDLVYLIIGTYGKIYEIDGEYIEPNRYYLVGLGWAVFSRDLILLKD